jgi:hypothetical protein
MLQQASPSASGQAIRRLVARLTADSSVYH